MLFILLGLWTLIDHLRKRKIERVLRNDGTGGILIENQRGLRREVVDRFSWEQVRALRKVADGGTATNQRFSVELVTNQKPVKLGRYMEEDAADGLIAEIEAATGL